MALTAKEKKQIRRMTKAYVATNGDDAGDTYNDALAADDTYARAELTVFAAKMLAQAQVDLQVATSNEATANKTIALYS